MEQNGSCRWPIREQWDVDNTTSYDVTNAMGILSPPDQK
jgi:hypothetical protein